MAQDTAQDKMFKSVYMKIRHGAFVLGEQKATLLHGRWMQFTRGDQVAKSEFVDRYGLAVTQMDASKWSSLVL